MSCGSVLAWLDSARIFSYVKGKEGKLRRRLAEAGSAKDDQTC